MGGSIFKVRSKLYDEAAVVWRQHKQWNRLVEVFERIGEIHVTFGNYQQAISAYRQAEFFRRTTGDRIGEFQQACNIARVYSLLGDLKRSEDSLHDIERKASTINLNPDNSLLANLYNNLGEVLSAKGNLDKTKNYFEKALKIWENLKDRQGEAIGNQNLGYVNFDSGEIIAAEQNFNRSLILWRELKDWRGEASVLTAQGHLRSFFLQPEEALDLHSIALKPLNSSVTGKAKRSRSSDSEMSTKFLTDRIKRLNLMSRLCK